MDTRDEQYLTVKELSEKIKFSQQTIYNMIHKGDFVKGRHYVKPRPKKILFLWSAVLIWLESPEEATMKIQKNPRSEPVKINQSLINI
jgi:predicted DNA-binding transcriptional regulator AlpA